jgi:hypothetical protein
LSFGGSLAAMISLRSDASFCGIVGLSVSYRA